MSIDRLAIATDGYMVGHTIPQLATDGYRAVVAWVPQAWTRRMAGGITSRTVATARTTSRSPITGTTASSSAISGIVTSNE